MSSNIIRIPLFVFAHLVHLSHISPYLIYGACAYIKFGILNQHPKQLSRISCQQILQHIRFVRKPPELLHTLLQGSHRVRRGIEHPVTQVVISSIHPVVSTRETRNELEEVRQHPQVSDG